MTKRFKFPLKSMVVFSALFSLLPDKALAQAVPTPVRDPNALALASKALQALAGSTALTDITLQATATYTAGSDEEMGPATLVALGNQQSLMTLNLTDGERQEIRNGIAGVWVGPDGVAHAMASHNCFIDASWFYPAFTLVALASDPTLSIVLVGPEVHNGQSVYHLALQHVMSNQVGNAIVIVASISTMQLYLDAATLLPAYLDFNLHPDYDTDFNIPFEIRYAAYQAFNGVQVPTRIQRYIENSIELDFVVGNAAVNSGVQPSLFAFPPISTGGAQ